MINPPHCCCRAVGTEWLGGAINHTRLIGSRSFQNYAFRGWLSLETMKLWLLALKKNTFFNDLDFKADIGQQMSHDPLNMPVEIWCAKVAPKLKNI